MLTITVAQDGSGDFASIAEAVLAVPYEEEALVQVGPGLYREKLICPTRTAALPTPSAATPPFSAAGRSAWRT